MAIALDPSQYQQSWRSFLNQQQAATGRAPTAQELEAYQTAGLEAEYSQESTEEQLAQAQQQLGIEQQQANISQQQANTSQQSVTQTGAYQAQQIAAQKKATAQAQQAGLLQTAISAPVSGMAVYGLGKAAGIWGSATPAATTASATPAATTATAPATATATATATDTGGVLSESQAIDAAVDPLIEAGFDAPGVEAVEGAVPGALEAGGMSAVNEITGAGIDTAAGFSEAATDMFADLFGDTLEDIGLDVGEDLLEDFL